MMVHINPKTIAGRPSTISVELMLTNLICQQKFPISLEWDKQFHASI